MRRFSGADGFVELGECWAEMIKYVANEPSIGLYFIQQHTQTAVPHIIKLRNNVIDKSRETSLHTQDLEDSVAMVRSMKECGFPIADEMIGDIKKSLVTMATKQPKRGLVRPVPNIDRTSFWGNYAQESGGKRGNYFSSVLKFSKLRASSSSCSQLDSMGSTNSKAEKSQLYPNLPFSVTNAGITSSQGMETDEELHLLRLAKDGSQSQESDVTDLEKLLVSEKFDDFKANIEAKLEEWLKGTSNDFDHCQTMDDKRV
ncbi:hypothetical protein PIB30_048129 [Stylosanthes scabra]|uniref:Uncharacterized protein n=1 Tax=Stylosanthes scabra TaxID=79078 RepID=A0ABU6THL3_9FABA|nr:hypothetical protein [Stylosanthes scabra]